MVDDTTQRPPPEPSVMVQAAQHGTPNTGPSATVESNVQPQDPQALVAAPSEVAASLGALCLEDAPSAV